MNLCKCGIHLEILKILSNKCVAIVIVKHIASQIGGQQQNMRQFQFMSLMPQPHIGPLLPAGWKVQNRYLNI